MESGAGGCGVIGVRGNFDWCVKINKKINKRLLVNTNPLISLCVPVINIKLTQCNMVYI